MTAQFITNKIVAKRYVNALFALAKEAKQVDKVWQDLCALQSLFSNSPKAASIIASSNVPQALQAQIITAIEQNLKPQKLTKNFLALLKEHNRLNILTLVIAAFEAEMEKDQGIVAVAVYSATKLDNKQQAELAKILQENYKKEIKLSITLKPELLSGFVVKVGAKMVDCSLATKLKVFEAESKKAMLNII